MIVEGKLKDRLLARLDAAVLAWATAHHMEGVRVLKSDVETLQPIVPLLGAKELAVVTLYLVAPEEEVDGEN